VIPEGAANDDPGHGHALHNGRRPCPSVAVVKAAMRSVSALVLLPVAFAVVLGGCSGNSASSAPPTTALNQPRPAVVAVHLNAGTSNAQASALTSRLLKLGGDITGTDWSAVSPDTVQIYMGSSETVAQIDSLLSRVERMPHVEGATVQFG